MSSIMPPSSCRSTTILSKGRAREVDLPNAIEAGELILTAAAARQREEAEKKVRARTLPNRTPTPAATLTPMNSLNAQDVGLAAQGIAVRDRGDGAAEGRGFLRGQTCHLAIEESSKNGETAECAARND